jgi:hypothetical protein
MRSHRPNITFLLHLFDKPYNITEKALRIESKVNIIWRTLFAFVLAFGLKTVVFLFLQSIHSFMGCLSINRPKERKANDFSRTHWTEMKCKRFMKCREKWEKRLAWSDSLAVDSVIPFVYYLSEGFGTVYTFRSTFSFIF